MPSSYVEYMNLVITLQVPLNHDYHAFKFAMQMLNNYSLCLYANSCYSTYNGCKYSDER